MGRGDGGGRTGWVEVKKDVIGRGAEWDGRRGYMVGHLVRSFACSYQDRQVNSMLHAYNLKGSYLLRQYKLPHSRSFLGTRARRLLPYSLLYVLLFYFPVSVPF